MRKRAQAWGLASIWKRWFTRPMLSWWRGREKMLQAFGNWRAVECGRLSSILMHERNVSDVTGFIIIIYFHASPSADDLFSKIWSPVMVSRKRWWWWKRSTPVAWSNPISWNSNYFYAMGSAPATWARWSQIQLSLASARNFILLHCSILVFPFSDRIHSENIYASIEFIRKVEEWKRLRSSH